MTISQYLIKELIEKLIYNGEFEEAARITAFFKYDKEAIASHVICRGGWGYTYLDACTKIGY